MRPPLLLLAFLASCSSPSRSSVSPGREAPPWVEGGAVDSTLSRTLTGPGWTVRYAPDAEYIPDPDSNHIWGFGGILIKGPVVRRELPNIGRTDGHSYYLMISTLSTDQPTVAAWTDSLRRDWNDHEMDEDSLSYVYPATPYSIGGTPALLFRPFCGDCVIEHYALKRGRTLVVMTLINGGLEAWSRDSAEWMARRTMDTFQWTEEH